MDNSFSKAESFALILELIKTGKLEFPRAEGQREYDPIRQAQRIAEIHAQYFQSLYWYLQTQRDKQ